MAVSDETSGAREPIEIETGLIIPVPAFESFIRHHRTLNSAVSPEGVPAHLTLLYPFLPPMGCKESHAEVASFFTEIEPFDFQLTKVGWFAERVVFLAPEDPQPFIELTEKLIDRWSVCIPYGGRHGGAHVPHLTLGIEGTPEERASLAEAAEQLLPVQCVADQAWLMIGTPRPAQWQIASKFSFGDAADQRSEEP